MNILFHTRNNCIVQDVFYNPEQRVMRQHPLVVSSGKTRRKGLDAKQDIKTRVASLAG